MVIKQKDWRVNKKKEKDDLEPKRVEKVVEVNAEDEEILEVLEEETEFEIVETNTRC